MPNVEAFGTQVATINTEHVLVDLTTVAKTIAGIIDLRNVRATDALLVRIYTKLLAASPLELVYEQAYQGIQVAPSGRFVTDASISNGSPNVSSATLNATAADVNAPVTLFGGGSGGANLFSKIITVTDATHVVLADNAGATASGITTVVRPYPVIVSIPLPNIVESVNQEEWKMTLQQIAGTGRSYDFKAISLA